VVGTVSVGATDDSSQQQLIIGRPTAQRAGPYSTPPPRLSVCLLVAHLSSTLSCILLTEEVQLSLTCYPGWLCIRHG